MSETNPGNPAPGKPSPANPSTENPSLAETVHEVQGVFPSDATLQDAIGKLTLAGYDRAEFSLPEVDPAPSEMTPEASAENPNTDVDMQQVRTLGTSMAGFVGAAAAAGATIATGGAAGLAVAAAAAVGVGSAAAANATGQAADEAQSAERDRKGAEGRLVLAVRTSDHGKADEVQAIMKDAGASRVVPVTRAEQAVTGGVNASSWTG